MCYILFTQLRLSLFVFLIAVMIGQQPIKTFADEENGKKQAAIVIDDFGNDMNGTKEMLDLPIPFTAAIMPFLPTTKRDAEWVHASGREVIVHLPMEPVKGKKSWLGPGAITTDLSDEEIRKRVKADIEDVPYAVGVNNHMGSKVTSDSRIMRIVLEVCKEKGVFFLDSRTSGRSVIGKLSREIGIKTARNHLFLDEVHSTRHIVKQISVMKRHLKNHDSCIAIGHVGVEGRITASVLKQNLPIMKPGVNFVLLSVLSQG